MYRVCTEGTLANGGFEVKVSERPKEEPLVVFFRGRDAELFILPAATPAAAPAALIWDRPSE